MSKILNNFFNWYNKHYTLNVSIALGLFLLQLIHLYWLGTHVIALKVFGVSFFTPSELYEQIIILVDYTEIPALITTGLIYINELRQKRNFKSALFIVLLLSQFLHIFWITDEFVLESFTGAVKDTVLPGWLAWLAILIDYLELPVIWDTI